MFFTLILFSYFWAQFSPYIRLIIASLVPFSLLNFSLYLLLYIDSEKILLENKKNELKNKGVNPSSNYEDGEAYDLYVITEVLDPGFNHCKFDEYTTNSLTSKYCALKE